MNRMTGLTIPNWAVSLLLFAFVAALLMAAHANHFELTSDEGIILDAAQRIVNGERLYADFFGYMSPGSYLLQAAVFKLAGVSLWSGRLIVILGFAIQCALLWWLVARLGNPLAAWVAVVPFFFFQASVPGFLTAQHRWDSGTLAMVFAALIVEAVLGGKRWLWFAAGVAIAMAAFITPSLGLLALATLAWCVAIPSLRANWKHYVFGGAVVASLTALALAAAGMLGPFLRQIRWLRDNYGAVNVMPYGEVIGGYGYLFEGVSGIGYLIVANLVLWLALPAVLPVVSVAGWTLAGLTGHWRKLPERHGIVASFLILCVLALVASTYPRPDVMHLAFVAAIPYALTALLFYRFLPPARYFAAYICLWAALMGWNFGAQLAALRPVVTPVGRLGAAPDSVPALERLVSLTQPGETLYVHPYMPVFYFLTQTRNPTRYSYLAPGMMTAAEEADALASLTADPPEWVLFLELSQTEFLRVFPNATELDHRFHRIESWIKKNYIPTAPPLQLAGYQLLRRHAEPDA